MVREFLYKTHTMILWIKVRRMINDYFNLENLKDEENFIHIKLSHHINVVGEL